MSEVLVFLLSDNIVKKNIQVLLTHPDVLQRYYYLYKHFHSKDIEKAKSVLDMGDPPWQTY